MATILAIIIAVLIDRYAAQLPGGKAIERLRSGEWINTYIEKMLAVCQKFNIQQSYGVILVLFVPLCLAIWLLKLLFVGLFGTIGGILFSAAALLYFLGNPDSTEHESNFIASHESSFAILFWFAILGWFGALVYWFLVIVRQAAIINEPSSVDLRTLIIWLHAVVAWIPARITGFVYALVGNFTSAFNVWLGCMRRVNMQSSQLLEDCGRAAVDANTVEDDTNLVDRAFFAWVVLSIIIVVSM